MVVLCVCGVEVGGSIGFDIGQVMNPPFFNRSGQEIGGYYCSWALLSVGI